ncbi:MAG TPA: ABC transporter permease [Kofleriaceae bacterium]|nr:ABC transporter permease [Kofleriaceae bacterium]
MSDVIRSTELVEINAPVSFFSGPREMWRNMREHHHLIANFIQRDIRLKYRDSALGYFWSLLEPLGLSAVYFVLFVILAGKPDPRYALWVLLGVITWNFFSQTLSDSLVALTKNESLIKAVYLPREIFAVTNVGSKLVLTVLSLLVAVPLMIYFGIPPTPWLLMVPLGLVLTGLLALGIGLAMSCLNVVNRDVEYFFRFVTKAGFFLSPVMWTTDMAGSREKVLDYLMLNPVAVPITMVRNGIAGHGPGVGNGHVLYSVTFCLLSFLLGAMIFKRFEGSVIKKL